MYDIPHYHYERVSSTNEVAKELLAKNDKVFVTADYQYEGRGRKGKTWEGESHKNVYLTYGVNETKHHNLHNIMLYQIIGSLAVYYTLAEYIEKEKIRIKYPNDIYILDHNVGYRKISGILSEHSYSGNKCTESILGIGININQTKFEESIANKATSMKLLGIDCNIDSIVEILKENLISILNRNEKEIFSDWKKKLTILNKEVRLSENKSIYKIESINDDGTLTGLNQNGTIRINNGDSITYEL